MSKMFTAWWIMRRLRITRCKKKNNNNNNKKKKKGKKEDDDELLDMAKTTASEGRSERVRQADGCVHLEAAEST